MIASSFICKFFKINPFLVFNVVKIAFDTSFDLATF